MNETYTSRLFAGATAEFRLVVACCLWPDSKARSRAVQCALQHSLQWKRVLSLARRHRVSGLVAEALGSHDQVPKHVREKLAEAKREILLANMSALRTQVRLAQAFQEHGLPFAVLKGTPLAMHAYGTLALRQSRDVDLLVNEADVPQVDRLLQTLAYRRAGLGANLTQRQQQLWMRARKHYEYASGSGSVPLEVHWRTTDNSCLMPMRNPLSRLERVLVAPTVSLPTLSHDELLLDLCVHGAGHAWFRLKWLADVAALLHQEGPSGQQRLLQAARHHGLERPVMQALYLCEALFEVPISHTMKSPSAPLNLLLHIAAAALMQENVTAPTATSDFVPRHLFVSNMLLRPGWRYRVRQLDLEMTAPSDWQQIQLPSALQWMYPVLRLPLWVKRRWFDPATRSLVPKHSPRSGES